MNITLDNLDSTRKVIVSADLIILHGSYRIHDFTVTYHKVRKKLYTNCAYTCWPVKQVLGLSE